MPRQNAPRTDDDNLAARIAYERQKFGWSYAGLAIRMTNAGCPINQSALYKIEKGSPRRTVSHTETRALATVFGIPLEELSVPPSLLQDRTAEKLAKDFIEADRRTLEADLHWLSACSTLQSYVRKNPNVVPGVKAFLASELAGAEDIDLDVLWRSDEGVGGIAKSVMQRWNRFAEPASGPAASKKKGR